MTLQELKDAIIDEKVPLSALLRRVKALAAELKSEAVAEWVEKEMNGYEGPKDKDAVPSYRKIKCRSFGDFSGDFGSQLKNAPIPPACLPDELKVYSEQSVVLQGVKTIESLVKSGVESSVSEMKVPWHPNNVVVCGDEIYEDMNCLSAWKTVGKAQLDQILDTIRNRLLDFVIELEKTLPKDFSSSTLDSFPNSSAQIQQILQIKIIGDRNVVVPGAAQSPLPTASEAVISQAISTGDLGTVQSTATKSTETNKSQGRVKRFFSQILSVLGLEVVKKWLGL